MSDVRIVTIDRLRARLRAVLGGESLLFERFDVALRRRDDALIQVAMTSLEAYPATLRTRVEAAMVDWLLGVGDEQAAAGTSLAAMKSPSRSIH